MRPIVHVVGWLLVGEAAVMTVPAVADALVGSPDGSVSFRGKTQ